MHFQFGSVQIKTANTHPSIRVAVLNSTASEEARAKSLGRAGVTVASSASKSSKSKLGPGSDGHQQACKHDGSLHGCEIETNHYYEF